MLGMLAACDQITAFQYMPCMMQKKDADIEKMVERNASLEEAVKQLRNKLEAEDAHLNQVGTISPICGLSSATFCCRLCVCLFGRAYVCTDQAPFL